MLQNQLSVHGTVKILPRTKETNIDHSPMPKLTPFKIEYEKN